MRRQAPWIVRVSCAAVQRACGTSSSGGGRVGPGGDAVAGSDDLDAAWAAEAAQVQIVRPARDDAANGSVINGEFVTDQQRRERTDAFLRLLCDTRNTRREDVMDLVYAAAKHHNTLKEHHLVRVLNRAAGAQNPGDDALVRAMTIVAAAADAADEAGQSQTERAATPAVWNALLDRVVVASGHGATRGPPELRTLVGDGFATEPQWWLCAQMELRGIRVTGVATLALLEQQASREAAGAHGVVRGNRVAFLERIADGQRRQQVDRVPDQRRDPV